MNIPLGITYDPSRPVRYITTKNCSITNNGVRIDYKCGKIIEDPNIIELMLTSRAPIAEVDEDDIVTCPHCGSSSSLKAYRKAQELAERAAKLMPGHR